MYSFKTQDDLKSFDEFVVKNGGSYLQCSSWSGVKTAWKPIFYSGYDGDEMVLTCLVLRRKLPVAGTVWYISCGPVCDYQNEQLQKEFAEFIKGEMQKHKATCAISDPMIPLRINGEECEQGKLAHKMLVKYGYTLNKDIETYTYKHPVQLFINLKDENGQAVTGEQILKKCEKGVRYSVRVGKSRGLLAKTYTYDDIEKDPCIMQDFMSVMEDTSGRNDFVQRDSDYCLNLLKSFKEETDIMLVYYDKQQDLKLENERLEKREILEKSLSTAPEKKQRGIREEIDSIDNNTKSFNARCEETKDYPQNASIPVAGGLTIRYAGVASCLFGGTRNIVRNNTRSSHYLNYLRICKSIDLGCHIHDLGYVLVKTPEVTHDGTLGELCPADNFVGICDFKKSMGSDYYEFIGEYILVGKKLRFLFYSKIMPSAKKLKMKLIKLIRKIKR
ncbi:MAG: aminoacyltransferase [Oscillospiraceae bacterium]|jgi:lipid II:glycine glycyltransferase (peptidoglycan interpeptide bridge formation enzyme)|nr:aminoacyltransferase [Oscillospiraceae bacterium]